MTRFLPLLTSALLGLASACDSARLTEPVADLAVVTHAIAGQVVTLDASGSEGSPPLSYTWRIDGQIEPVATERMATVRFAIPGHYRISLTVRDRHGLEAVSSTEIEVGSDFVPPLAAAGDDIEVEVGEAVPFDGARSVDNVAITRWSWDFDASDGPWFDSHTPATEHTYLRPGLYRATLTVHDGAGNEATDERLVRVRPAPDLERPVADAGEDRTVHRGATTILDASRSHDNVGIASFDWSAETALLEPIGDRDGAVAARWNETGRHTVRLDVTDAAGNRAHDDIVIDVIVDSTPPVARLDGPRRIEARRPVTFDAVASHDNTEIVAWIWDGVQTTSPTFTRSFSEQGRHTVELVVIDGAGLSDTATLEVDVGEAVPVAVLAHDDVLRLTPGEFVEPSVELEYADLSRTAASPRFAELGEIELRGASIGAHAPTVASVVVEAGGRQGRLDVAVGPSLLAVDEDGRVWPLYGDGSIGAVLELDGPVVAWDRSGNTVVLAVDAGAETVLHAVSLPELDVSRLGALRDGVVSIAAISSGEVVGLAAGRLISTSGLDIDVAATLPPGLAARGIGMPMGEVLPVLLEPIHPDDVVADASIALFDRLTGRPIDTDPSTAALDRVALAPSCAGRVELLDAGRSLAAACLGDAHRPALVQPIAVPDWEAGRPIALDMQATAAAGDPSDGSVYLLADEGAWRADLDHLLLEPVAQWQAGTGLVLESPVACVQLQSAVHCADGRRPVPAEVGVVALVDARWYRPSGWIEERDVLAGERADGPFGDPAAVRGSPAGLGPMGANAEPGGVYTIANGQTLTISLQGHAVIDGPGHDFVVFENAFYRAGRYFSRWIEPAAVEVSFDGANWVSLSGEIDAALYGTDGADPRAFASFAGVEAVLPVAGLFDVTARAAGGDRFDLATSGLPEIRHLRLRDVADDGYTPDIDAIGLRNRVWR